MISTLTGTTTGREDSGAVVVEVHGVGYAVIVSDRDRPTFANLLDATVTVFTRLRISEHAHTLYGFLVEDDRSVFDKLCSIDGVGPTTAIRALSIMTAAEILDANRRRDEAAFRKVPGIGPKTSPRLVEKPL